MEEILSLTGGTHILSGVGGGFKVEHPEEKYKIGKINMKIALLNLLFMMILEYRCDLYLKPETPPILQPRFQKVH
ncbi:MAG: hypothetical protein H8E17_19780 [Deltaproteobacteria bacterium]|nr:hypothetical protein [Deltaproteobacteria bacterium]